MQEARAKPDKTEVWCNIVSKTGRYHASISFDGVVTDRVGEVMGFQVIAEMVEEQDILVRLKALGVAYAQGFGIQQPHPIEKLAP